MTTRCGIIAFIGAPNAGKSSLVNALVGAPVTVVTRKAQTTRCRMLGIDHADQTQMVYLDVPGIFRPSSRMEKSMVSAAWQAIEEADFSCLVIDATRPHHHLDFILRALAQKHKKVVAILNKIDLIKKVHLLPWAHYLSSQEAIKEIFMVSAVTQDGIQDFKSYLATQAPEGPWLYPADQAAVVNERLLANEITRGAILENIHEEIPYQVNVQMDFFEPFENGDVRVVQTIYVMRPHHRGILLGNGGQTLKRIGEEARATMTQFFKRKVHLLLHVTVDERWMDKHETYHSLGLQ